MPDRTDLAPASRRHGGLTRFLGDSPLRVFVKLVIVSVLVGMAMRFFNWQPQDILWAVEDAVRDVWNMGFAAFDNVASYLILGAVVVVPVFLVLRLLSYRR